VRRTEQIVCLFWIGFALLVCVGSLRLELGTISDPGPGALPFGAAALLGILAVAHLANVTLRRPGRDEGPSSFANVHWKKGLYVVIALFLYFFILPMVGYLITTFLLMVFLFGILERKRWWVVLLGSGLVIGLTYFVFEVWLMVQFPRGLITGL
jgi:hypothetical protein